MKTTVFHLGTCSTCQRILKEWQLGGDVLLQDIKIEKIKAGQLDEMARLAGSYEALFSRRAMKFRSMGLADQNLGEKDYRRLILEEYTFLKRPVLVIGEQIFVGSAKKNVAAAAEALKG